MTVIQIAQRRVARQVEKLFAKIRGRYGEVCENPVTGSRYVYGVDPIEPQKEAAVRALLARGRFAIVGPKDAQPLPISDEEIESRKYPSNSKLPAFDYIASCIGYSIRATGHDFDSHPGFEDFARGVMASEYAPDFVKNDEVLLKLYPPCRLPGLGPGLVWEPSEIHAAA